MKKKSEPNSVERIIVKSKISGEPILMLIKEKGLVVNYLDNRFTITREVNTEKSVVRESVLLGVSL